MSHNEEDVNEIKRRGIGEWGKAMISGFFLFLFQNRSRFEKYIHDSCAEDP